MDKHFWKGKKVLVTGHTGFKGGWLSLWLSMVGAEVTGFALPPPTEPNIFNVADVKNEITSIEGDIRSFNNLESVISQNRPEIIFHLAAQPIVRESYRDPVTTYQTNIFGTVNLFEAIRCTNSVKAVVNVTSDKCYENHEWVWGYRETDPLGGFDPYSSSKACSEIITTAYRNSFFNSERDLIHRPAIATARAGNVIGGGDWGKDRLIPDIFNSIFNNNIIVIRNPNAIRPWQHVLDPLNGYLLLAESLYKNAAEFGEPWNFGPSVNSARKVSWVVEKILDLYGKDISWELDERSNPHEATLLSLDCSKAIQRLGWSPKLDIFTSLKWVVEWMKEYRNKSNMKEITENQILDFMEMTIP